MILMNLSQGDKRKTFLGEDVKMARGAVDNVLCRGPPLGTLVSRPQTLELECCDNEQNNINTSLYIYILLLEI